ncbi:hypothetical protein EL18_02083 [Nitratireductor basaltis]|uniref:Uncharacterized protein n=1 Tax=Nitratireductor basaltis TaxID=472175 RepID=A0A084UDK5_9HYPH|nr:hypothetical protein EL18_02083 [Nitratireductor basaltis]
MNPSLACKVRNAIAKMQTHRITVSSASGPNLWCWRIYGVFKPHFRFAVVDWTRTRLYSDKSKEWRRLMLFNVTVYERGREWSGLPNASR